VAAERRQRSQDFVRARAAPEVALDSPDGDDNGWVDAKPSFDGFQCFGVLEHEAPAVGDAFVVDHDRDVVPDGEREFGLGLLLRDDPRVRLEFARVAFPGLGGDASSLR
jgi:hypothetical protein